MLQCGVNTSKHVLLLDYKYSICLELIFFIALVIELKLALLLPKTWSFLDRWRTSASVLILSEQEEEEEDVEEEEEDMEEEDMEEEEARAVGRERQESWSGAPAAPPVAAALSELSDQAAVAHTAPTALLPSAHRKQRCVQAPQLAQKCARALFTAAWRGVFSQLCCATLAAFPKTSLWRGKHPPAGLVQQG